MKKNLLLLENSILILCNVFLAFIVLFVISYSVQKERMNILSNNLYSTNSIKFFVEEPGFQKINELEHHILFKEKIDINIDAIYISGYSDSLPLISGRLLNKKDFVGNAKIALIGKEFNDLKVIGGKDYVVYKEEKFEVVGVIGEEYTSDIDTKAYLNLSGVYSIEGSTGDGAFILDGKGNNRAAFNKIKENAVGEIKEVKMDIKEINHFLSEKDYKIEVIFWSFSVIMYFLIVTFWIYKKRNLISIQRLIGHSSYYIYFSLLKINLQCHLLSFLLSIMFSLVLNKVYFKMNLIDVIIILCMNYFLYLLTNIFLLIVFQFYYTYEKSLKVLRQ